MKLGRKFDTLVIEPEAELENLMGKKKQINKQTKNQNRDEPKKNNRTEVPTKIL